MIYKKMRTEYREPVGIGRILIRLALIMSKAKMRKLSIWLYMVVKYKYSKTIKDK